MPAWDAHLNYMRALQRHERGLLVQATATATTRRRTKQVPRAPASHGPDPTKSAPTSQPPTRKSGELSAAAHTHGIAWRRHPKYTGNCMRRSCQPGPGTRPTKKCGQIDKSHKGTSLIACARSTRRMCASRANYASRHPPCTGASDHLAARMEDIPYSRRAHQSIVPPPRQTPVGLGSRASRRLARL